MRKSILILGLVLAVVGIVLLPFAEDATSNWDVWFRTPILFQYEQKSPSNWDIPVDKHFRIEFDLKRGTRVEFSFSANNTVDFVVMDGRNYEQWKAGKSFDLIHKLLNISSTQFMFVAPKTDKFCFVIISVGEYPVRVSETYTISYLGPPIAFVAAGLIGVGAIVAYIGFRLKPSY